jgi:hypothetical protein
MAAKANKVPEQLVAALNRIKVDARDVIESVQRETARVGTRQTSPELAEAQQELARLNPVVQADVIQYEFTPSDSDGSGQIMVQVLLDPHALGPDRELHLEKLAVNGVELSHLKVWDGQATFVPGTGAKRLAFAVTGSVDGGLGVPLAHVETVRLMGTMDGFRRLQGTFTTRQR